MGSVIIKEIESSLKIESDLDAWRYCLVRFNRRRQFECKGKAVEHAIAPSGVHPFLMAQQTYFPPFHPRLVSSAGLAEIGTAGRRAHIARTSRPLRASHAERSRA